MLESSSSSSSSMFLRLLRLTCCWYGTTTTTALCYDCLSVSQSQQVRSSLMDAATSPLLPEFIDATLDFSQETKPHDDISSYQHAMKRLSLEMLPEKETTSTTAFTAGFLEVTEVHSPVADNSSDVREPDNRSGLLVFDLNLETLSTELSYIVPVINILQQMYASDKKL